MDSAGGGLGGELSVRGSSECVVSCTLSLLILHEKGARIDRLLSGYERLVYLPFLLTSGGRVILG